MPKHDLYNYGKTDTRINNVKINIANFNFHYM